MRERIVIVGGGAAGLSAAVELAGTHSVTILEARDRLGGRIHTARGESRIPMELGAEFIHGNAPETWRLIRASGLSTHEVPDQHWLYRRGEIIELPDFWDQLSSVTEEINPRKRDRSFADFLSELRKPRESL